MTIEVNKIYKGDCLELMKDIPDDFVNCIITDPPYNINLVPPRRLTESIENDSFETENDFITWFHPIAKEWNRVLKENSFIVCFTGWSSIPTFRKVLDPYFKLKSMPVWVKNNFGIGYYTRPQYEPCFLYFKGKPEPLQNPITDVWKFNRVLAPVHSCEKPVPLMRFIVNSFTNEGDIILDSFIGSGATIEACHKANRAYIGMEIEQKYIDIAQQRLRQKTLSESLL